jgi:hypothetical protein
MNLVSSQHKIRKRQIWQSVLTLLLFCASLYVHSEHYVQVEVDGFSNFELHDCHLCQQGIDPSISSIDLYPVAAGITNFSKTSIVNAEFISATYVSPPLRAPPMLSCNYLVNYIS